MGRCNRCDHRWRGHWSCSRRCDWRSRRRSGRHPGWRSDPGGSGCALRSAATWRLSLCALGRDAWFLLQPLYRARLRSSRNSPWRVDSRCGRRPAFPKTLNGCRRLEIAFDRSVRLRLKSVHERLSLFSHFQQFWPRTVVILARQFACGVKSHVGSHVLIGRCMVQRVAWSLVL